MRDMLEHAREALAPIAGRQRADVHSDRMLQLALTRLVETVRPGVDVPSAQAPIARRVERRLVHEMEVPYR
ncbi:MAG: hypothetical protein PVJ73_16085 [Acidobacteriota bacterium]|jgi:hypothetical protein